MPDKKLTYRDYHKYFSGNMSPEEAHAFEKEIMKNGFDQDAYDGLSQLNENEMNTDINEINARIQKRIKVKPKAIPLWFKYAAGIAILIGVGSTAFFILKQELSQDVAYREPIMEKMAVTDSGPDEEKVLPDENAQESKPIKEKKASKKDKKKDASELKELTSVEDRDEVLEVLSQELDTEDEMENRQELAIEEEISTAGEIEKKKATKPDKTITEEISIVDNETAKQHEVYTVEPSKNAMPTRKKATGAAMRKTTTTEAMPPNEWSIVRYKQILIERIQKNDLSAYNKSYRLKIILHINEAGKIKKIKINGAPDNQFENIVKKSIMNLGKWKPLLYKGKAQKSKLEIQIEVNLLD